MATKREKVGWKCIICHEKKTIGYATYGEGPEKNDIKEFTCIDCVNREKMAEISVPA